MARWAATTPRWREMILNVAIFAAAIWVLKVVAIQSMRLSVRIAKRWLFYSPGLCKACGYDLRGAPHDRCPECGAKIAANDSQRAYD